jgi:hypothetical protein
LQNLGDVFSKLDLIVDDKHAPRPHLTDVYTETGTSITARRATKLCHGSRGRALVVPFDERELERHCD